MCASHSPVGAPSPLFLLLLLLFLQKAHEEENTALNDRYIESTEKEENENRKRVFFGGFDF
jgi:hypothetical protein